jgi:uncharacterized protein YdiU (UPF0061 family)
MAISGETIDYGPCAFMDTYAADTVFSSIDAQGRYAYRNQPGIVRWNLARLAETLLELIDTDPDIATKIATDVIDGFPDLYARYWLGGMRAKLGLTTAEDSDVDLVNELFAAMTGQSADYTLVFRRLSQAVLGDDGPVRELFADTTAFDHWLQKWQTRMGHEAISATARAQTMNQINPIYIPRNHKVEEALAAAEQGDLTVMDELLDVVQRPFDEFDNCEDFALPAPAAFGHYRTFCGT